MRHPMFEHQCVLGGKVRGELWEHAVGWLLLSPSAHRTEGAQPGNAGATWMRVLGGSRGRACGSGLALLWSSLGGGQAAGLGWPGTGQVREEGQQAGLGVVLPDCSGRCWEEGLVSLRKSRLWLRKLRPQTSVLSEGPISKVPASQYQAGQSQPGSPETGLSTLLRQSKGTGQTLQSPPWP